MSKILLIFTHNEDFDIQKKTFEFNKEYTIKEMLLQYLRDTNSRMILDPNKIMFMYGGKILNHEKFFNKKIKELFKHNNIQIQITDTGGIIGGNIYLKKN